MNDWNNNNAAFKANWKDGFESVGELLGTSRSPPKILIETIGLTTDGAHDNDLIDELNALITEIASRHPWDLFWDVNKFMFNPDRTPAYPNILLDGVHWGSDAMSMKLWGEQVLLDRGWDAWRYDVYPVKYQGDV